MANPKPLDTAVIIDSYRLESVIQQTDHYVLYRASHTRLDKKALIEEYLPKALVTRRAGAYKIQPLKNTATVFKQALSLFKNQAIALKNLSHPNVVQINKIIDANSTTYLILPVIDIYTLQSSLDKKGRIKSDILLHALLSELLHGFDVCHKAGLFHLNLNPENIWLTDDGQVQLSGFGATLNNKSNNRQSITGLYTNYQAIELMSKQDSIGPWSDLYSLGAVLYHCVTGHPPLHANDRWDAIQHDQCDPVTELAKSDATINANHLLGLIDWMLQFSTNARPSSATAALAALSKTEPLKNKITTIRQATYSTATKIRAQSPRILQPAATSTKTSDNKKSHNYGLYVLTLIGLLTLFGFFVPSKDESDKQSEQLATANKFINTTSNNDQILNEDEFIIDIRPEELSITSNNDTSRADVFRTLINVDNEIEQLLKQANDNLALNQLTIPEDSNALRNYRAALRLNQNNSDALAGVHHIIDLLLEQSELAAKSNLFERANTLLDKATKIDSTHPDLSRTKVIIDNYSVQKVKSAQIRKIDQLVDHGDQLLLKNNLSDSDANQALDYYFEALEQLPDHQSARDGVLKVVDYFLNQAGLSFERGSLTDTTKYIDKVQTIEPDNPTARILAQQVRGQNRPSSTAPEENPSELNVEDEEITVETSSKSSANINTSSAQEIIADKDLSEISITSSTLLNAGINAYYSGRYAAAFELLNPLAEQDVARAQFRIGVMHRTGRGVQINIDEGNSWLKKALPGVQRATTLGLAWAQSDLASLYEEGLLVSKKPREAVRWYTLAAQQGFRGAQTNLGVMYATGNGVEKNKQAAVLWLSRAAEQGDTIAQKNLNRLLGSN